MSDPPFHIVFAEAFDAGAVEKARGAGRVTLLERCDEQALRESLHDCDALLVRSYAKVTRGVIESAARLRVIGRGGTGLDNVDLAAARECGVVVVHTPEAATQAAADLTVGLLLSLVRHIAPADGMVRRGEFFPARERWVGRELGDLTLGIMGLGRIGKAVARRCGRGFGMRIVYNDIVPVGPLNFEATALSKLELYGRADVVSLHVPLTDDTRHFIDDATLALFRRGAYLINMSRGAVVDGAALAEALSEGRLGGAALDVFDPEPLPADHPLLSAPNTLFTPHVGARTHRSLAEMNAVINDVIAVLEGRPPRYPA